MIKNYADERELTDMVNELLGIQYNIEKANRTDRKVQNLASYINADTLRAIHKTMDKRKAYGVVYADDFVCCFQYKKEAELFYELLKRRMGHFCLTLEENKTRLIYFGRYAEENLAKMKKKPETFDFLGFMHYCSKSRNGNFRVKRRTAGKKFRKKCKQMNITIRDMRFEKKKYILEKVNQILIGYYHYYGITDNYQMMDNFRKRVIQILFFWMNRRSQRKSYTWDGFNEFLKRNPIVRPKICVSIYG